MCIRDRHPGQGRLKSVSVSPCLPDGSGQRLNRTRLPIPVREICRSPDVKGLGLTQSHKAHQETGMAKGQKKSNKEVRKPKTAKGKPVAETKSFLSPITKK